MAKQTKYLENKIGMIKMGVIGHAIGICAVANEFHKQGKDYFYNYEAGKSIREMIEKEVAEVYRHGFKLGRASATIFDKNNLKTNGRRKTKKEAK